MQPFRAWTGEGREAGSWQGDAIREITGSVAFFPGDGGGLPFSNPEGSFFAEGYGQSVEAWSGSRTFLQSYKLNLSTSRSGPTASENRPVNISVPTILYLGLRA